jgi:hypothetical protein
MTVEDEDAFALANEKRFKVASNSFDVFYL